MRGRGVDLVRSRDQSRGGTRVRIRTARLGLRRPAGGTSTRSCPRRSLFLSNLIQCVELRDNLPRRWRHSRIAPHGMVRLGIVAPAERIRRDVVGIFGMVAHRRFFLFGTVNGVRLSASIAAHDQQKCRRSRISVAKGSPYRSGCCSNRRCSSRHVVPRGRPP